MGCSSSIVAENEHTPKWDIFLHSNEALSKYRDDPSMPKDCNISQLELRLFFDDPILIRTLGTFAKTSDLTHLFMCWIEIQEFKCLNAETVAYKRKVGLKIFEKYVALASPQNVSIEDPNIRDSIYEVLAPAASPIGTSNGFFSMSISTKKNNYEVGIPNNLFDRVQMDCFCRIHDRVFVPFQNTDEYKSLADKVVNHNKVKVDDFNFYEIVGRGGFAVVAHGVKISTGIHYAIKIMPKSQLLECFHDCPHRVDYEKQAMEKCKHPFIIGLDYSLQTPLYAVMVMELGRAGTLKDALENCQNYMMSEDRVSFYGAEICLAIGHLHSLGMMYRDLKPENVLLNSQGHVKLVDLGGVVDPSGNILKDGTKMLVSSIFHSGVKQEENAPSQRYQSTMRAISVMGTKGFMAPEMLKLGNSKGYSKSVDWWSLGVTLFELLCGDNPFTADDIMSADTGNIANGSQKMERESFKELNPGSFKINYGSQKTSQKSWRGSMKGSFKDGDYELMGNLEFIFNKLNVCGNPISMHMQDFVKCLLNVCEKKRLGSGHDGGKKVQQHPLFDGLNWDLLEQMLITPPFIPTCPPLNVSSNHKSFGKLVEDIDLGAEKIDAHQNKYYKTWDYVSAHSQSLEMGAVLEKEQIINMGSQKGKYGQSLISRTFSSKGTADNFIVRNLSGKDDGGTLIPGVREVHAHSVREAFGLIDDDCRPAISRNYSTKDTETIGSIIRCFSTKEKEDKNIGTMLMRTFSTKDQH